MRRGNGPRQPGGGRQIAGPRGQDRGKPAGKSTGKPTGKSFGQRPGGAGRAAGKRRRPLGAEAERSPGKSGPGKSASGPRKAGRSDFSDAVNPRPVAPLKGVSGKPAPRPAAHRPAAPRPATAAVPEAIMATGVQTVRINGISFSPTFQPLWFPPMRANRAARSSGATQAAASWITM